MFDRSSVSPTRRSRLRRRARAMCLRDRGNRCRLRFLHTRPCPRRELPAACSMADLNSSGLSKNGGPGVRPIRPPRARKRPRFSRLEGAGPVETRVGDRAVAIDQKNAASPHGFFERVHHLGHRSRVQMGDVDDRTACGWITCPERGDFRETRTIRDRSARGRRRARPSQPACSWRSPRAG